MKLRGFFVLLVLLQTVYAATTQDACYVQDKNTQKAIHTIVEGCHNIGSFSLGGLYDGSWEKLTYFYPKPWPGSFFTVSVDNTYYATSEHPKDATLMDAYALEKTTYHDGIISLRWRLPEGVLVEQIFQTLDNGTSIIVTLSNENSSALTVGVRLHLDTMLGVNDGAPIYIPGDGLITKERQYNADSLNFRYWKAYNRQDSPTIVATGTIDPDLGLTYPDRVVIADWKKSKDTAWDYLVDESHSILGDSAVILYYYNIILEPRASATIITNYGNEAPVLPVEKGTFALAEILSDNVYGTYCPNENVKIMADVVTTRSSNQGNVKLTVTGSKGVIYSNVVDTGAVAADSVKTITFSLTLPDRSDSYDVQAILEDANASILDTIKRDSMLTVDTGACIPVPKKSRLWIYAIIILILLVIIIAYAVQKGLGVFAGSVEFSKTVDESGKVRVEIKNKTKKPLTDLIIEDKIPTQAEVHIITLGVVRRENYIIWNIGVLESGANATLEYTIRGVNVLPAGRARWDGGEITSK